MAAEIIDQDNGLKKIVANIQQLNGHSVEIGIMGNDSVDGVSVIDYAVYNEFGTSRIPARPFMSKTFELYAADAMKYLVFMVNQMIEGKGNAMSILNDLGNWYEFKVKMTIVAAKQWAVPNAPSTVKMKKSSWPPLIDTGRMLGAVKFEVK